MYQNVQQILNDHYQYVLTTGFQGWDVFDGLNSRLVQKTPFYKSRLFRLMWIQFFKKCPLNFRGLAGIPQGYNPKALALFMSGLINMACIFEEKEYIDQAKSLYGKLLEYQSSECSGAGWGYNFPWQARAFYVPAFKPNMIVSVFAGNALLDLFEYTKEKSYLDHALAVADFILKDLVIREDSDSICLAYIPGEKAIVHNANLLGAAFLARLYNFSAQMKFKDKAEKTVRFSVKAQRDDGAWVYGAGQHHQWVDNFHTGFNLTALHQYQECCQDMQFEESIVRGLDFHLKNHFTDNTLPKYTNKSLYPLDIHCFSQAILTFMQLKHYIKNFEILLENVLNAIFELMYDSNKHYFYYQKNRFFTNRIPYIRWSQAWMFYALSKILLEFKK